MVVKTFFSWLAEAIMKLIVEIQSFTIKNFLLIEGPMDHSGVVGGFAQNMEIFGILYVMVFLVGLMSMPFAEENITLDVFLFQMFKVLLFVLFIGTLLDVGVDVTNSLIEFLWPDQGVNQMTADFQQTTGALAAGGVVAVLAYILGSISALVWVAFAFGLLLREYLVIAVFILAPIYAPFMFLTFGPFKLFSRLPRMLLRVTVYLLIAGVFIAGFMQVGVALAGGFEQPPDDLQGGETEAIDINTIEEMEVQSNLAEPNSYLNRRGSISLQTLEEGSFNPSHYGYTPNSTDRASRSYKVEEDIETFWDKFEQEYDGDVETPQPLAVHRARQACNIGLRNGGFDISEETGMSGPTLEQLAEADKKIDNEALGLSKTESIFFPIWAKNILIINKWVNGENIEGEPSTDNIVEGCVGPLLEPPRQFQQYNQHPEVMRVSPAKPSETAEACLGEGETISGNYGGLEEYYTDNIDCISEYENEKAAELGYVAPEGSDKSNLAVWRESPKNLQFWFFEKEGLFGSGISLNDVWSSATNKNNVMLYFSKAANPGGFISDLYWTSQGDGYTLDSAEYRLRNTGPTKTCEFNDFEMECQKEPDVMDSLKQFLMFIVSMGAPVVIMFYSTSAALTPMSMMTRGDGSSSSANKSAPDAGGSTKDSELRNSAMSSSATADPISTDYTSDHLSVDTADQAVSGKTNPSGSPVGNIEPDSGFKDLAKGAASRGFAGGKELTQQGLGGSPISWARSGISHFKENPIGSPPNASEPSTNEELLDEFEDYAEELPTVRAEDIQHPETQEGTPVNLEGSWTFNPSKEEEPDNVGMLTREGQNDERKKIPIETDRQTEGLEVGKSYEIQGAIIQNEEIGKEDWTGEYNSITLERNSNVREVDESSRRVDSNKTSRGQNSETKKVEGTEGDAKKSADQMISGAENTAELDTGAPSKTPDNPELEKKMAEVTTTSREEFREHGDPVPTTHISESTSDELAPESESFQPPDEAKYEPPSQSSDLPSSSSSERLQEDSGVSNNINNQDHLNTKDKAPNNNPSDSPQSQPEISGRELDDQNSEAQSETPRTDPKPPENEEDSKYVKLGDEDINEDVSGTDVNE